MQFKSEITEKKKFASSFITAVAWFFIIIGAVSTLIISFQNLFLYLFFPAGEFSAAAESYSGSDHFSFHGLYSIEIFQVLLFLLFLLSFFLLISAIGLLRRKNWARIVFIVLLTAGIIWNGVYLWIQKSVLSYVGLIETGKDAEMNTLLDNFISTFSIESFSVAIILSALYGWVIWKLSTPPVRNEFISDIEKYYVYK